MKPSRFAYASVIVLAAAAATPAFAQLTPGSPDGILNDTYHLNQHPQMEFAASAPTGKFQQKVTDERRKADNGDPNGCNLQCPADAFGNDSDNN